MTELQRLARRLADDYEFECQGGPLRNCTEWRALCAAIDTLVVAPTPSGTGPQRINEIQQALESTPASPQAETCRVCGGYGFVAQKQTIDDGWGEVDTCPACTDQPAPVSPVEPEPPTNPPCVRCGHALSAHRPEFGACDGRDRPCACPEYQVPTVEPEPCVWRITSGPLGTWVKPTCVEGAIPAPWGTERAKACHLCGAPLKVEREQPDEQPAEIPAAPHKPVVNLMEALKKSLDSLDSARKR